MIDIAVLKFHTKKIKLKLENRCIFRTFILSTEAIICLYWHTFGWFSGFGNHANFSLLIDKSLKRTKKNGDKSQVPTYTNWILFRHLFHQICNWNLSFCINYQFTLISCLLLKWVSLARAVAVYIWRVNWTT